MRTLLAVWMGLAIALVAVLAYWDERRESSAALDDLGEEQAVLAQAVSAPLSGRRSGEPEPTKVLAEIGSVEQPGSRRVFLARTGQSGLIGTGGERASSETIERALWQDIPWVRLSRSEAARLGLPARMATAGLKTVDAGPPGKWGVAVVATARRERDRELHAQWRLAITLALTTGLVLLFGGLALHKQKKELKLERELAIAELERAGDERLIRANRLATLGALGTGIAHELSTPLGVIVGRAEQVLPKVSGDERTHRAVEAILEQGHRIECVIRDFLNLARGNAASLEHVAPSAVARTACDLVSHRFSKAGVNLELAMGDDLPKIACDCRLFEQVLVNLLLNALDACRPAGHVELRVHTQAEQVAFVVTDDGAGITPEAAARALEPFFTTKAEGQGTGLGLAIANEIVKHHRGSLAIAPLCPRPNGDPAGTRAEVVLPAVKGRS